MKATPIMILDAPELKRQALPLRAAIELLIEEIDSNFPPVLNAGNIPAAFDHTDRDLTDAFQTTSMIAADLRFSQEFDPLWRKEHPDRESELMDAVFEFSAASDALHVIIGFTAGMRASGLSKEATAALLWAFTRPLRADDGSI